MSKWDRETRVVIERGLAGWNVVFIAPRRRSLLGHGETQHEACTRALDWMNKMDRPELWAFFGVLCRDAGEYRVSRVRARVHDLLVSLARQGAA